VKVLCVIFFDNKGPVVQNPVRTYFNGIQCECAYVCRWAAYFKTGYEYLKDAARQRRTAITMSNNVGKIHQMQDVP
jgi:hypothetical protein